MAVADILMCLGESILSPHHEYFLCHKDTGTSLPKISETNFKLHLINWDNLRQCWPFCLKRIILLLKAISLRNRYVWKNLVDSQWFKETLDFFSFVPGENISIRKFLKFQCQLLKFNFMFCSNYYEGEKDNICAKENWRLLQRICYVLIWRTKVLFGQCRVVFISWVCGSVHTHTTFYLKTKYEYCFFILRLSNFGTYCYYIRNFILTFPLAVSVPLTPLSTFMDKWIFGELLCKVSGGCQVTPG